MKIHFYFTILLVFFSCQNQDLNKKNKLEVSEKHEDKIESKAVINDEHDSEKDFFLETLSSQFKNFKYYDLTDTIFEDLTGDHKIERILFVIKDNLSGIIILDGATKKETTIGLGVEIDQLGNDLSWVDYWAITYDKKTTENIFEDDELIGGREVELKTPGIVLHKSEVGGGVIIFEKGKYRWVHQTC